MLGVTLQEGFPRLYAAASLKQGDVGHDDVTRSRFSAALCRGLIEAGTVSRAPVRAVHRVFRGFMPRPH